MLFVANLKEIKQSCFLLWPQQLYLLDFMWEIYTNKHFKGTYNSIPLVEESPILKN